MKRRVYSLGQGILDALHMKGRVILLWASVLAATLSSLLAVSIWGDAAAMGTRLGQYTADQAVRFQIVYPDQRSLAATWPHNPLDSILRASLARDGGATTSFPYPTDSIYSGRVFVCMGAWPDGSPCHRDRDESGVRIGSKVTDLDVGATVHLGGHSEQVLDRLNEDASMFLTSSPWEQPLDLSNSIVFITDYKHFVDSYEGSASSDQVGVGPCTELIIARLTAANWTSTRVDEFVHAVAQSTTMRVIPRLAGQDNGFAVLSQSSTLAVWAGLSLTGLSLVGFVSVLRQGIRMTLRSHGIHRLVGASLTDIRVRLVGFTLAAYGLPVAMMMIGWSVLPIPYVSHVRGWLPWLILALTIMTLTCAEIAARHVTKHALLLATRPMQ